MKILNLDGRYAHFSRYKYALQFRGKTTRTIMFNEERKRYAAVFEKLYGPANIQNPYYVQGKSHWSLMYIDNPQWMWDKKHNRIYYKDESVLSMVLLMIPESA